MSNQTRTQFCISYPMKPLITAFMSLMQSSQCLPQPCSILFCVFVVVFDTASTLCVHHHSLFNVGTSNSHSSGVASHYSECKGSFLWWIAFIQEFRFRLSGIVH